MTNFFVGSDVTQRNDGAQLGHGVMESGDGEPALDGAFTELMALAQQGQPKASTADNVAAGEGPAALLSFLAAHAGQGLSVPSRQGQDAATTSDAELDGMGEAALGGEAEQLGNAAPVTRVTSQPPTGPLIAPVPTTPQPTSAPLGTKEASPEPSVAAKSGDATPGNRGKDWLLIQGELQDGAAKPMSAFAPGALDYPALAPGNPFGRAIQQTDGRADAHGDESIASLNEETAPSPALYVARAATPATSEDSPNAVQEGPISGPVDATATPSSDAKGARAARLDGSQLDLSARINGTLATSAAVENSTEIAENTFASGVGQTAATGTQQEATPAEEEDEKPIRAASKSAHQLAELGAAMALLGASPTARGDQGGRALDAVTADALVKASSRQPSAIREKEANGAAPADEDPSPERLRDGGENPEVGRAAAVLVAPPPAVDMADVGQGTSPIAQPAVGPQKQVTTAVPMRTVAGQAAGLAAPPQRAMQNDDKIEGSGESVAAFAPTLQAVAQPQHLERSAQAAVAAAIPATQVSQELAEAVHQGGRAIVLRVAPPGMGELGIHVRLQGSQVQMRVRGDAPHLAQLLQHNLAHLQESLQAKGLQLASMDFQQRDGSDSSANQNGASRSFDAPGNGSFARQDAREDPQEQASLLPRNQRVAQQGAAANVVRRATPAPAPPAGGSHTIYVTV